MCKGLKSDTDSALKLLIHDLLVHLRTQFQKFDCIQKSGRLLIRGKTQNYSGLQILLSSINRIFSEQRNCVPHSIHVRIEVGRDNQMFETLYRKQDCDHD